MSLSAMQVFNDVYAPAVYETLSQMVAAFNEASNGAIILNSGPVSGDFLLSSFYDSLMASQRRVDRYAAQGAVAATDLSQSDMNRVKVAGGFGPIRLEPSQMAWLQKPTAESVEIISRQLSEAIVADQLNTAIRSLVGAIGNQVTATNDQTGVSKVTQTVLNNTHALFGDMSTSLVCTVMNGALYHQLIAANLTNAQNLYQASGVLVVDILGKKVIVTDSAPLTAAGVYKALSLVPNACVITNSSAPIVNIETSNGQTRIESTFQADYDFVVGVKGYSWDTVNGGKSPTDADLVAAGNWDLAVASIKNSAGVLSIGDV